jgi:DNA-binding transcriptional LysR family regulator
MTGVEEFAYDVGFIDSTCSRPALRCEPWISDRLAIIAAPNHRLAAKRSVSVQELADVSWCLQPPASMTRVSLTMTIIKYLNPIRIGFMSANPEAIKGAVMAGAGLGCLSRFAVGAELRAGALREVRVREFTLERVLSIVTRKDVYEGDLMAGFLSFARSHHPAPR